MNSYTPRRLRSETIVSEELYVYRQADRQLTEIIDGMGRPGYVLVARQMGKTNLLLNMKRRLESQGDMVIYVDLSQKFESARACFRYIIDLAIESRPDVFESIEAQVGTDRSKAILDPSLEYTRHLRLLIRTASSKRFVVVLDEIDSLVHAAYSDTVLAHVRSTYFVRTNYAEFKTLTYVLSGVAEPAELIKDKNISPFNIGEKIYLDDFSKSEFDTFVANSGIQFPDEVIDRSYYWSQGNPRITWDLLAELETRAINPSELSALDVDNAVKQLYLTSFNIPPVDHIRTLVENDASLRASLMAIRYNKSNTLDERAKSKLYLAGIIGDPGYDVKIRNPIIDEALSETWLTRLEAVNSDPVVLGNEHYAGRRYLQAKEFFEKAQTAGMTLSATQTVIYGISLYHLGLHSAVIETLSPVLGKVRGEIRTHGEYRLGSSYLLEGKPDNALLVLQRAAEEGTGIYRFPAQILRAGANYQAGPDANNDLRLSSMATILSVAAEESVGGDLGDATVVPSLLFSVGHNALSAGYDGDAVEYLDSALALAPPGLLPAIYITKFTIETNSDAQRELALLACNAIIEHQLHPVAGEAGAAIYTERGLVMVLLALSEVGLADDVRRLAAFVVGNDKIERSAIAYIADLVINFTEPARMQHEWILRLLDTLFDQTIPDIDRVYVERAYCVFGKEGEKFAHVKKLVGLLAAREEPIDETFLSVIVLSLGEPLSTGHFGPILEVATLLGKLRGVSTTIWDCLAEFYKMTAEKSLGMMDQASISATSLIEMSTKLQSSTPNEVLQIADNMIAQANNVIKEARERHSEIPEKFGRNVKVRVVDNRDGRVFLIKYKLIEARLKSGDYSIV